VKTLRMLVLYYGAASEDKRSRGWGKKDTGFPGDDLLFHPVTRAVPSALKSLASGFGMGPGVPSSLQSPEKPVVYVLRPKF
jgi:hypothetical protein